MKFRHSLAAAGIAAAALLSSSVSFGATKAEIDERVHHTMQQFYQLNPAHKDLVARAKGILVFPHITKGGVGVGGEFGEGALRIDGKNVAYYSVSAASVGLTLGLAKHKEVILFMSPYCPRVPAGSTTPRPCSGPSWQSSLVKKA
jgi:lipid-binding SYLF domain-containing protein